MFIQNRCFVCNKTSEVNLNIEEYKQYQEWLRNPCLINLSNIFPNLLDVDIELLQYGCCKKCYKSIMKRVINMLDIEDIVVSDSEIKALAKLSHKTSAEIIENKVLGRFMMCLKFDKDDEQTIISSDNYEFFKKFIKYGGNIDLADVFVDD